MQLNKYYIIETTKADLKTLIETLPIDVVNLFVGSEDSIRWNVAETKCVLKTKYAITDIPEVIKDHIQYTNKEILIELNSLEWTPEELTF